MRDEQTLKNLRPTVQTQATAVSEIEIFGLMDKIVPENF